MHGIGVKKKRRKAKASGGINRGNERRGTESGRDFLRGSRKT